MKVTDPLPLLSNVDPKQFNSMRAYPMAKDLPDPEFVDPASPKDTPSSIDTFKPIGTSALPKTIQGRIQRFGDNIDTDQVPFHFESRLMLDNSICMLLY
jgi:hypothetical protein